LVMNEANACGTPAIGYRIPGYRDLIKDGYSGISCEPNIDSSRSALTKTNPNCGYYSELCGNALANENKNYEMRKIGTSMYLVDPL
jgi:glycosyltransferase involved in cell wall biosynthesis